MGPAGLILTSWEAEGEREAWAQEPEASAPRDQGPEGQRQGSIAGNVMLGDSNPKGLSSSGTRNLSPLSQHRKKTASSPGRGNGYIYFNEYFLST